MKNSLIIALSTAMLVTACAQRQPTEAPAAPVKASSAADRLNLDSYVEYIRQVSDDRFAGRGPGDVGEKRFVPWLVEQYQALGLKPGPGGSYTQDVPVLELVGKVSTPLTFSQNGASKVLKPGTDFILSSHRAQAKTSITNADLVFVGYGVSQAGEQWNDYAGLDVKGKIVVTLVNDPGFHVQDPNLFKGKTMTYAGRWTYKFEEAARQGAAGCLIIHDTAGAAYGWEVLQNGWGRPEFKLGTQDAAIPELDLQGWITEDTAKQLFTDSGLDLFELRKQANQRGFKPVPLKAKASATVENSMRQTTSQNVVGVIEGSEKPEEVIIYSAHWDHLGLNFQMKPDGVFNGAVDNATGVAALLEMAKVMQGAKPKRSMVFLAVTLEELGLMGSKYYAQNPLYPLRNTVANINIDALPPLGPTSDVVVIGSGNSELEDLLKPLVQAQNRALEPEPTPENGFYFRSDHFNFARVGVPALYIKSGPTHREKGRDYGIAWAAGYTKDRYHKPADQLMPEDDYRGVIEDMALMLGLGEQLANSTTWPNWYPQSEFRAARDAMRPAQP